MRWGVTSAGQCRPRIVGAGPTGRTEIVHPEPRPDVILVAQVATSDGSHDIEAPLRERTTTYRGGTAYRIRTGDLRLERAVSWASRRMRLRSASGRAVA